LSFDGKTYSERQFERNAKHCKRIAKAASRDPKAARRAARKAKELRQWTA